MGLTLLKKNVIKRRELFITLMVSYILILIFPLVAGLATYNIAGKKIQSEINKSSMAMLKQVQLIMDSQIRDVEKVSLEIATNSMLYDVMHMKEHNIDADKVRELSNELKRYLSIQDHIGDLYIYFKNIDYILNYNSFIDSKIIYDNYFQSDNFTYANFHSYLNANQTRNYSPIERRINQETMKKTIAYTQSVPIIDIKNSIATILVILNENQLDQAIENVGWRNRGTTFIINKNNQILISSDELVLPSELKYDTLDNSDGIMHLELNGEKVVVSFIKSTLNDHKYVNILPYRVFVQEAEYIRNITIIILSICALLGIGAVYLFTRLNYSPIKNIIDYIGKNTGASSGMIENEYEFILKSISKTLEEKKQIDKELEKQSDVLKNNLFVKLLKGKIADETILRETLSSFGISFDSENFAVMLFYIENFDKFFEGGQDIVFEEKLKLVQLIISNIIQELANKNHNAYIIEADDMIVCLVNFTGTDSTAWNGELVDIAKKVQQIILENFKIYYTTTISRTHQTITSISEAYQEALAAMEYKFVMGIGKVIHYDYIKHTKSSYYYPMRIEQKLINNIKAGDFEKSKNILNDIFKENLANVSPSIQTVRCLMFNVISTLIKAVDEISEVSSSSFFNKLEMDKLFKCETIADFHLRLIDILEKICNLIISEKKDTNQKISEDIMSYVEEQYHDMNLNVSQISQVFSMTPNYLSKIFKEYTNESLLNYINKVKVEKAKELLRTTDLSIGEVANKVGYVNSNALIRAFNKFEGITPGKFKGTFQK